MAIGFFRAKQLKEENKQKKKLKMKTSNEIIAKAL